MTADVNVTERVARELIADAARSHLAMGTEYATRLARRLLAVLSDPEVLAGIAGVLREHMARPTGSLHCKCGWRPALSLNDTDGQQHRDHQAEALADWLRGQG